MNRQDRRAKRASADLESLEGRVVLSPMTDAVVPVTLATDVATPTSTSGDPIRYAGAAQTTALVATPAEAPAPIATSGQASALIATSGQASAPVTTATLVSAPITTSAETSAPVMTATLVSAPITTSAEAPVPTAAQTAVPVSASLVRGVSYLDLQGSAHGSTTTVVGNPDVGTTLKLQGKGQLQTLGSVKVAGSLHGTGFIAGSQGIMGDLKLSNGKGSVTLHLQGPPVKGFTAPGSGTYSFTITGGTGAYKHDIGNGSVDLVLGAKSFTLNFHGKPNVY